MSLSSYVVRGDETTTKGHPTRFPATTQPPYLPIICISSIKWDSLIQRPHHFMLRYSRRAPVLWVNPIEKPRMKVLIGISRRDLRQVAQGLWVLSLTSAFPLDASFSPIRSLNESIVRRMIQYAADRLGFRSYMLWGYRFDTLRFLPIRKPSFIVYDCVDDWSVLHGPNKDVLAQEERMMSSSDVVFTVSKPIHDKKAGANPNTYLVPNGVDFDAFSHALSVAERPADMTRIPHPIVGFSGAVYEWVDLNLVADVARLEPQWSFVFVGPVKDLHRVPKLPNVHFLGKVPYEDLPYYVAAFDVCMMPFTKSALLDAMNPIKMYEFLATGKPIVSIGFPELRRLGSLVSVAENSEEFREAIAFALKESSPEIRRARMAVAHKNSWDNHFETMMRIIHERREAMGG